MFESTGEGVRLNGRGRPAERAEGIRLKEPRASEGVRLNKPRVGEGVW